MSNRRLSCKQRCFGFPELLRPKPVAMRQPLAAPISGLASQAYGQRKRRLAHKPGLLVVDARAEVALVVAQKRLQAIHIERTII